MNPKVTIESNEVTEREGSFKGSNGDVIDYATRKQNARLDVGGFAYPYEVRLEAGQKPYAPGVYEMDLAAMLEVNKKNAALSKYPVLRAAK